MGFVVCVAGGILSEPGLLKNRAGERLPAMSQAVLDSIPGPISSRHTPLMLLCHAAPKKPRAGSL
jgi:hypothetical protein